MTQELSKQKKYEERKRILLENHGWKLGVPSSVLPPEDKAGLGGGLRCFRMIYQRDTNGIKKKDLPKLRCGNGARKGSFFCRKHGGGNQNALTTGHQSMTHSAYRGVFNAKLGGLFDAFINDPSLMDTRPELAALRLCLRSYLDKLANPQKEIKNPKILLKKILKTAKNGDLSPADRFLYIRDLCLSQSLLTDGDSIDRIAKVCEIISKIIERMEKAQNKDEFVLSPDGFKIFIRCMVDIIKGSVSADLLPDLKQKILEISVRTQGDFSKYEDAMLKKVDNG